MLNPKLGESSGDHPVKYTSIVLLRCSKGVHISTDETEIIFNILFIAQIVLFQLSAPEYVANKIQHNQQTDMANNNNIIL